MFVREDDAVSAIMAANDARYSKWETEQAQNERIEGGRDWQAAQRLTTAAARAMRAGAPEADVRKAMDDGDLAELGRLEGVHGRETSKQGKIDVAVAKAALKEPTGMSKQLQGQRKLATEHFSDKTAFGSQVEALRKQAQAELGTSAPVGDEDLRKQYPDLYERAKEWDSNPVNEFDRAREMKEENYVALGGKLPPDKAAKRKFLWKVANDPNQYGGSAAPAAAGAAPTPGKKPLTASDAAKFKEQAKGNRAEAERLAREAGFDF